MVSDSIQCRSMPLRVAKRSQFQYPQQLIAGLGEKQGRESKGRKARAEKKGDRAVNPW
jgi:hypothetical protein